MFGNISIFAKGVPWQKISGIVRDAAKGKGNFSFEGENYSAPDLGNIHFGAVGKAYGMFTENYMLKKAGEAQIAAGTSLPEWQKYQFYKVRSTDGVQERMIMLPPYGDDPRDQNMIKRGFGYFKNMFNRNSNNHKTNNHKTNAHKKHNSSSTGMMYRF